MYGTIIIILWSGAPQLSCKKDASTVMHMRLARAVVAFCCAARGSEMGHRRSLGAVEHRARIDTGLLHASNLTQARLTPNVVATCSRVALSMEGEWMLEQKRPIVVHVQTLTASKSNLCEGSRADWREGMSQCLHQLTGLSVIVRNDDGTCADCSTLKRVECDEALPPDGPPAALVILLGGGWDPQLWFQCANNYCGLTGEPFVRCPRP